MFRNISEIFPKNISERNIYRVTSPLQASEIGLTSTLFEIYNNTLKLQL